MDPDIKSLFDELQIPPLDAELLDGEPPEPVDDERIRAFFAGELDRPEESLLCHLMANYRVWYDASQEFVRHEHAQRLALAAGASDYAGAEGAAARAVERLENFDASPLTTLERVLRERKQSGGTAQLNEGDALRELRQQRGWSLEDVAQNVYGLTGVKLDVTILRAIEAGQRPLSFEHAVFLAKALGRPAAALLRRRPRGRQAVLLRESVTPAPAAARTAEAGTVDDARRELLDSIDLATADAMLAASKKGRQALNDWMDATEQEPPFRRALLRALACLSLLQDHRRGLVYAEQACQAAGDDERGQLDARYLRGRAYWYQNDEGPAIEDFRFVREQARRLNRPEREAQACLYLARLLIKQPHAAPDESREALLDVVDSYSSANDRPDLQLLAIRARMIYLRQVRRHDEAIRIAREVLHAPRWKAAGLERILDSVRSDFGVSLRGLNEEGARWEAEGYYDEAINSGRVGSHVGMCLYLKSDLYSDRMVEALHAAAEASDEAERLRQLAIAEQHRLRALELARLASQELAPTGDDAAQRKAAVRELILENQPIEAPRSERDVLEDFAARHQQLTQLFLGTAAPDGGQRYSPAPNVLSLKQLKTLLEGYFAGVSANRRDIATEQPLQLDDFLRSDTLLAVPWLVGSSLVVRIFGRDDAKGAAVNVGWFTVDNYRSVARGMFRGLLELDEETLFPELAEETLATLQQGVRTVNAMTRVERDKLARVAHVAVVGPYENVDWLCPVEWLRTHGQSGEPGVSLLEMSRGALVHATTRRGPLRGINLSIPSQWDVFATDQTAGETTIYKRARRAFGDRVERVDQLFEELRGERSTGVMIFAHSTADRSLEIQLEQADWGGVTSVVLLFCNSGQFAVSQGPFVDGVALRVRQALGDEGMVIAARMPVDLEDAIQLAEELQLPIHHGLPLAEVVTHHLRSAQRYGASGYQKPWVILG